MKNRSFNIANHINEALKKTTVKSQLALHFFFTAPVLLIFSIMNDTPIAAKENKIKYLDSSIHSKELAELSRIRDSIKKAEFNNAIKMHLSDHKISKHEMLELRMLAEKWLHESPPTN